MKYISFALVIALFSGCAQYQMPAPTGQMQYQYDPGVQATTVKGIAVGMSPRRVLEIFNASGWKLTSESQMTLEDMVEGGVRSQNYYISTSGSLISDLEVFFQDRQVIFIRESRSISASRLNEEMQKAKSHLTSLGDYSATQSQGHYKLLYQPFRLSYVYYDFYKESEMQKNYRMDFVVANVKY